MRRAPFLSIVSLVLATVLLQGMTCNQNNLPASGSQLFMGPQTNPVALSADGTLLYVANTAAGTLSVLEAAAPHGLLAEIPVGLEPVGVAVRPKVVPGDPQEDELVFVTNHISDSIAVVSRQRLHVTQTIQALAGDGTSTSDEPTGIAFSGPNQAFVTLDHRNELVEIAPDGGGLWSIGARATLTAQGPRAVAVANGNVYVAAFESGNQSEFPSCGPFDPINFNRGDPVDEGCLFPTNLATLAQFATSPNMGGEVIHDSDIPDRDLFVFDAADITQAPSSLSGIGTLLYGIATAGDRVYLTQTDARNKLDGLENLANRMFDNRLSFVDCNPGCGAVTTVDLDANAFGVPVPTPYGVAASGDGQTLVVSVAGSDGVAGLESNPAIDIPGLVTLDASGTVLGHLQTGAIPQGVALASDGGGAATTAYVLNTVDGTLSVVDVSTPASPSVSATVTIGADPTRPEVKSGRIQFASARASSLGNFSCESCHPNGHLDQVLWVINTIEGPEDVPGCNPVAEDCPEPRSTMPIRGLRDTLPLHWVGNLADPFPGVFLPEDAGAPDCDLQVDGEVGCIRHLVDAALGGVMCEQDSGTACANGPSGAPGALTGGERDDMAAFLAAVAYPPSPTRAPTDVLSSDALDGLHEFHTDMGGLNLGGVVTCADDASGCHALPLGVQTNSPTVGRFDAPTMRGIWDRTLLFSNGIFGSEEFLASAGFDPSGPGMTEFGSLAATFPGLFTLAYGMPVDDIWSLVNEMSVGLPGLTGRQISLTGANSGDAGIGAALAQIEAAAAEGRITAVARSLGGSWRFTGGLWKAKTGNGLDTAALRGVAVTTGETVTVTAELPAAMEAGGAARQPLLFPPTPDTGAPDLPVVSAGVNDVVTLSQAYVDAAAAVLIDGVVCGACSVTLNGGSVDIGLNPAPGAGDHALQVLNPSSYASPEVPLIAQ